MKQAIGMTIVGLLLTAAGCSSEPDVSYDAIVGDLTPELQGMTERPVDIDRNIAMTDDVNGRNFWNDLGRVFYTNAPSRLSPYPITTMSGQPR